ncbi:uncharacterized protein A1O5_02125 [Cladophialophora psammophila CBS 110553]|uniref:BZIP domain-containing protein n=1 Tax=Cladophialophora psammophila CBS 110553 TaxID=1182543 RepID=W9XYU2_9EURO|nr:uncharacterized protein A1O5_02125 [Cladophialophora psammophila CBS 110553]EXJ75429.1 hypothetical protein A1O5_02125 [Cladophialophora psammophila CBS 110553]
MPSQEQSPMASVLKPQLSADCRRAKKRQMDRMNQQRKRKRDREHLQRLQENVQLLQQDKASSLVSSLMTQRDLNEERMLRHRKRLLQIKGLIEADLADLGQPEDVPSDKSDADALGSSPNPATFSAVDPSLLEAASSEPGPDSTCFLSAEKNDALDAFLAELSAPNVEGDAVTWPPPMLGAMAGAVESSPLPSSQSALDGRHSKIWRYIEQLISHTKSASTLGDTELDMHIIITAVSQGWTQFSQAVMVDARWSCLRELDEKYFAPNYNNIERLAILTIASQTIKQDVSSPHLKGRAGITYKPR